MVGFANDVVEATESRPDGERRITAALAAVAGIPTERLEEIAAEISPRDRLRALGNQATYCCLSYPEIIAPRIQL